MDHTSNTSQRIRPILKAMERSIEDARRKRGGTESPRPATGNETHANGQVPAPAHDRSAAPANGAAAPTLSLHSASQPAVQPIRPPSGATANAATPGSTAGTPAATDQPVRLKARPKRWLPASA